MLCLKRRIGEKVYLFLPDGTEIVVTVADIDRGKVRLAFTAPPNVLIWRQELLPPDHPAALRLEEEHRG